jgi:hypothetical protein
MARSYAQRVADVGQVINASPRASDLPGAACRDSFLPPEAWQASSTSPDAELAEAARFVCAGCPERLACLEQALSHGAFGQHGILGGLGPSERRALIRARKLAASQAGAP